MAKFNNNYKKKSVILVILFLCIYCIFVESTNIPGIITVKTLCLTLTVLGLVRFRASVSQLLRWLYVLLLQDITHTNT